MKRIDVLKLADSGYTWGFPESSLLTFARKNGKPNDETGDLLAKWIVTELSEAYNKKSTDLDQLTCAVEVLRRGRDHLNNAIFNLADRTDKEARSM